MNDVFRMVMVVVSVVMIAACASTGGMGGSAPPEIRTGVVEQINMTEVKSTHDQGSARSSAASRVRDSAA